ncbi:MAG: nucleoside deaminase [Candidatus Promineifilaceae bacterium]|nr:nucleoside deaminase [Candidatus Promineifilaceae bacterium]
MNEDDVKYIRYANEIALRARNKGNNPFGAVLVDIDGKVLLEGENTQITNKDVTGHAETNLMREACKKYSAEFLSKCTLYASTEPCPMCSGAIFWGNVKRVVFGLSEQRLYEMFDQDSEDIIRLPCRELFEKGRKSITVIGPVLEEEALKIHEGYWI